MSPRSHLNLNWILVAVLTVFAVAPLTYPGFLNTDSGFLPVFNAAHPDDAPNWGRLADPARGEGKLPYLLAWPFVQLSGSGIAAIKWGYGLAFLLGALGIYAWTRPWLGARGGVLAAAVYTYLPWHLNTVYVRGAYAEAWLWAFWPWLLWAIDRLNKRTPRSILVGIATGLPALVATLWTQPGLAVLALPLFAVYGAAVHDRKAWRVLHIVEGLALMLLLLWVFARRVSEAELLFADHFVFPFQLFSPPGEGELSFQLGIAAVGLSVAAVALWMGQRNAREGQAEAGMNSSSVSTSSLTHPLWFWAIVLLVLVLLCLPVSDWLWQPSGLNRFLTYPWQLLALTGPPLAFLAGSIVRADERLATLPAWAGLVALVVLASYPYLAPRFTQVDPGLEPVALFQPAESDAPQILLLDYEIDPPTEITPTLALTLTWQAIEPISGDYTAFVHILAGDDTKAGQRDTWPCDGECPTGTWQPGELILDRYQIALAPDAPPGPYRLAIGLYLLETQERAIVVGREDKTVTLNVP